MSPVALQPVDRATAIGHALHVRWFARPVTVLLALLFLTAAAGDLCAGWHSSADARMACCADGACGMHRAAEGLTEAGVDDSDHGNRIGHDAEAPSQAEADACCAMAETQAMPPAAVFALDTVLAPADAALPPVDLTAGPSARVEHTPPSGGGSRIARHILLSVFLI